MKSVVIAALVLFMTTAVMAGDPGSKVVVVNQKKSGLFKVIYDGAGQGEVTFSIADQRGLVIYSETLSAKTGFVRPVNFEGMAHGEYTITIADVNGKQVQKINYRNETSVRNVHVAKVADEGKYLLAVANDGSEEINVKIYDGNNNLVLDQDHTIEGNFGLVYNLKQVNGTPTFEITDNTGKTRVIKY